MVYVKPRVVKRVAPTRNLYDKLFHRFRSIENRTVGLSIL